MMTVSGRSVQKREKGELVLFMLMITERTMADKDRILSDQPDVFPVDHHILSSSEKTEKTLFAVYHDRKYFCIFCIYLYIIHKADPASVQMASDGRSSADVLRRTSLILILLGVLSIILSER